MNTKSNLSVLTAAIFFLAACSSSNFSGSSGAGNDAANRKSKKGSTDLDYENDLQNGEDDRGRNKRGGDDSENDDDDGGDGDSANAGDIVTLDEAKCLKSKGDNFRILFALDNSGSTTKTDPGNIRRSASMQLIDKFTDFVKANPDVDFRTATIAFSGVAVAGSNGWITLSNANRNKILSDITTATTTSAGKGTDLMKGLNLAGTLLRENNASGSEKRQRNYLILLSDGQANGSGDSMTSLPDKMDQIVGSHGIAVYSVIIGSGSSSGKVNAMNLMESLALPVKGAVGRDHVGTFVHARDADAIDQAFANFFRKVTTGC